MSNSVLERYNKFISNVMGGCDLFDFTKKEDSVQQYVLYMLNRTQSMFKWEGLPDTVPERMVELYLQINGFVGFTQIGDDLYAMRGGLGGKPDAYYMPTVFTVANPALDISRNLVIGEECVIIPNDACYLGLMPMFNRYASGLAENDLSINIASIMSRIIDLISATDDRTKESALQYLKDIRAGKLGVIASSEFFEGIKTHDFGTHSKSVVTDLIELQQYYKASWFNELGLNANYNMKREALSTAESQLNDDALLPLVDNMLYCRQLGADAVNELYGTNITVDLASSWEDNQKELDAEQEQLEEIPDQTPGEPNNEGGDSNESE